MRFWWVNQNQTYRHEVTGGYLWSPKRKSGGINPFYESMREVAPGDIQHRRSPIFCWGRHRRDGAFCPAHVSRGLFVSLSKSGHPKAANRRIAAHTDSVPSPSWRPSRRIDGGRRRPVNKRITPIMMTAEDNHSHFDTISPPTVTPRSRATTGFTNA